MLSVLKHQFLEESERDILRKNMDGLISDMDKLSVPFKVQNALFWAAERYDVRTFYLNDMLNFAYEKAYN